MIITNPDVLDYIKGFEEVEKEVPQNNTELYPEEQITLYTLTKMFSIDPIFRAYISDIIQDYAIKYTELNQKEFQKTLATILTFISILNKKESQNELKV